MANAARGEPTAPRFSSSGPLVRAAVWALALGGFFIASAGVAADSARLDWLSPEPRLLVPEESDAPGRQVHWAPLLDEKIEPDNTPLLDDEPLLDDGFSLDEELSLDDELPLGKSLSPDEMRQPLHGRPAVSQGDAGLYPEPAGGFPSSGFQGAHRGEMLPQLFFHPGRHRGIGQPLLCESWRYRPFGVGWFMGMMQGSTLIDDWTGTDTGFFSGYRFTWDYDHYWGCEFRYGFASLPEWDSLRAKIAQEQADTLIGLPPDDPQRRRYDRRRNMDVNVWDVNFVYYPWGDAAWRPYALIGLGGSRIGFQDRLGRNFVNRVLAMPLGLGLKYRWNSRWALRFDVLDNIIFGAKGVETMHNFSATAGVELRFGGTRKAYWPYNPGRHYW